MRTTFGAAGDAAAADAGPSGPTAINASSATRTMTEARFIDRRLLPWAPKHTSPGVLRPYRAAVIRQLSAARPRWVVRPVDMYGIRSPEDHHNLYVNGKDGVDFSFPMSHLD